MTEGQDMPQDMGASADAETGSSASHGAPADRHPAGFDPSRGLYIYAVRVSQRDTSRLTMSLVQGYRIAQSEDEARGKAVTAANELKPDFSIDDVVVLRVSDAAIAAAHAIATETRRAETTSGSVEDEGAGLKGIAHD